MAETDGVVDVAVFDPHADAVAQMREIHKIKNDEILPFKGHEYIEKKTVQRVLGTGRRGVEKLVSTGRLKQEQYPIRGRKPLCIYSIKRVADIWAQRQKSRTLADASAAAGKGMGGAYHLAPQGLSSEALEAILQRVLGGIQPPHSTAALEVVKAFEQATRRMMVDISTQLAGALSEAVVNSIDTALQSRLLTLAQIRANYSEALYHWAREGVDAGELRNYASTPGRPKVSRFEFETKAGLHRPSQPPAVMVAKVVHGGLSPAEIKALRAAS